MLQKIKELYAVVTGPDVGEPRMFMKTNEIVELTWNVAENKRVGRSPRSVFSAGDTHVVEPGMFMKTNQIIELT